MLKNKCVFGVIIISVFSLCCLQIGKYKENFWTKKETDIQDETQNQEDEFTTLLRENRIRIRGNGATLSEKDLESVLQDVKNEQLLDRYQKYLDEGEKVTLTAKDYVEIHYYTLTPFARKKFIHRVSGEVISVEVQDGGDIVLISYNY